VNLPWNNFNAFLSAPLVALPCGSAGAELRPIMRLSIRFQFNVVWRLFLAGGVENRAPAGGEER
jgi:hypothetical protein